MPCHNKFMLCSVIAAILLVGTIFTPSSAAPESGPVSSRPATTNQTQPKIFTVRYVCFVTKPIQSSAVLLGEALAQRGKIPPVLDELQEGSRHSMNTTPGNFLGELQTAQKDHGFQMLLCGSFSCINGSQVAAGINAGPQMDDVYQCTLNESMFLEQNSPVMLTLRHTGKIAYTSPISEGSTGWSRGGPGWTDCHTDNIVIGRTYSQGIEQFPDGRCFVYAFCVLPGRLDQTASAWTKAVKEIASHKTAAHSKTAAR